MHPLLAKKIEQLDAQITELRGTLEANRDELAKQHKEKEDLLQKQWRERKHVTTLERVSKDFDALEAENKRYHAQRKRLRDGLRDILRLTRALRNANAP
jgi:chromosome segregation ATPase